MEGVSCESPEAARGLHRVKDELWRFRLFFWSELLRIFPTKKWMVIAVVILWCSQLF